MNLACLGYGHLDTWHGEPSKCLWQAVALAGGVGFACAIGIHPLIGYSDFVHLLPAYAGVVMFVAGLALTYGWMHQPKVIEVRPLAGGTTSSGAANAEKVLLN